MMRTIGAISDTHGLLRPQALAALGGCDPIIHAGDVGSPDVLARLGALAPVHAVRGNVDQGAWSANLPVTQRIEIDGFRIYVLHILAELDPQAADKVDAVIYGHSTPAQDRDKERHTLFQSGQCPQQWQITAVSGFLRRGCFTPATGHWLARRARPKSATRRHMQRSKHVRYSITSSARTSKVGGTSRPIALAVAAAGKKFAALVHDCFSRLKSQGDCVPISDPFG